MVPADAPKTTKTTARHLSSIPVVLVHGLWLSGLEFFVLRDRLRRAGFAPTVLHYSSMRSTLDEAAESLREALGALGPGPVHVVAHSLGGLVALAAFARDEGLPPGRVILLGSPVQGSRAARAVAQWKHGPHLLGSLASLELCRASLRRWESARELAVIAGSRPVGLGRFVTNLLEPHDGTVCVDETVLPGAAAHVVLDVTHTGMLVSQTVAEAVIAFLREGRLRP
jgi:pimeloyl-ACP methyl ester carboxylesterase